MGDCKGIIGIAKVIVVFCYYGISIYYGRIPKNGIQWYMIELLCVSKELNNLISKKERVGIHTDKFHKTESGYLLFL